MKIRPVGSLLFFILIGSIFLFTQIVWSMSTDVVINEIGAYEGTGYEWVEIWNKGSEAVDINNWKFVEEGVSHGLSVSTTDSILDPGEYGAICQDDVKFLERYPSFSGSIFDSSWGSLNESGEEIGLKDSDGNWAESLFTYPSASDYSLERVSASVGASEITNWYEHPSANTIGGINYWTTYVPSENQLPVAVISGPTSTLVNQTVEYDGTDSTDADGSVVSYLWKINEESVATSSVLNYQFLAVGNYILSLEIIDDAGGSASTSLGVQVAEDSGVVEYSKLIINEFQIDPPTSSEKEWIEIYNPSTSSVDLSGWLLFDGTGQIATPTSTIPAQGFFVVELASSKLNNTGGDIVILKNPNSLVSDQVAYGDWNDGNNNAVLPKNNNTVARKIDGEDSDTDSQDFAETTTPTKGYANIISAPVVKSSGGGGGGTTVAPVKTEEKEAVLKIDPSTKLIITEILPNPKGVDTLEEFIEIKNVGVNSVDLTGWYLGDASTKYKIKEGIILPNSFLFLKRSTTKISFNNSGEEIVKILKPDLGVMDQVKYLGPVGEDESWSRNSADNWSWTAKPTPGAENIFEAKNLPPELDLIYSRSGFEGEALVFDASDTVDPEGDTLKFVWEFGDGYQSEGEIVNHEYLVAGKYKFTLTVVDEKNNKASKTLTINIKENPDLELEEENNVTTKVSVNSTGTKINKTTNKKVVSKKSFVPVGLQQVHQMDIGDAVMLSGYVAVMPGVFGTQYFYITDEEGNGVQIYMYKKDFPDFEIGDGIQILAELSQSYGEMRAKVKEKNDIKKLDKNLELATKKVGLSEVDEEIEGSFVEVEGEVTETKSTYIYIDDGSDEAKVSCKKGTNISGKNFKIGDIVKVKGIVNQTKNGFQILPRSIDDIEKIGVSTDTVQTLEEDKTKNSQQVAETYLTATAGGLTSILIGLFAKARGRVALGIAKKVGLLALNIIRKNPKV